MGDGSHVNSFKECRVSVQGQFTHTSLELGLLPHHHHHRAPLREVVDGAAAAERAAIMSRRRSAQSLVNQAAGPSRVYSGNACIYMPAASSQLS